MLPGRVTIYEVGPRDGLQNESANLSVDARLRLIEALAGAGLRRIEIGSFVRPDWIPQLADTDEVARRMVRRPSVRYAALVPNRFGLDRAVSVGLREVAVFMSGTESHNLKNTNKTVAQSLEHFAAIVPLAKKQGMFVRAYLSTIWGCPYEGKVDPRRALDIARQLRDIGADEISLGVTTVDTSIGGMGGCPYAPGAAGNLATEDLVSMLADMGIDTGVNLDKLIEAGALAQQLVGHKLAGRRLQAALGRRNPGEARPSAAT